MPERPLVTHAPEGEHLSFFHFGESLADLARVARAFSNRHTVGLSAVQSYLERQRLPAGRKEALLDVLQFMTGPRGRRLVLRRLRQAVEQGRHWRRRFQALGCRGFSFHFCADSVFRNFCLSKETTLKVALLTDPGLYYPPRVRQALRQLPRINQHLLGAIGWMLGQERQVGGRKWWYITNIQSDLMSHGASCLREIFRGWQRALFWLTLRLAASRRIAMIAIPPAKALADSSDEGAGGKRLEAWQPLYDGVASFFALERAKADHPVNVQPMLFLPETWCSVFYGAAVGPLWKRYRGRTPTRRAGLER
jgi:hypothetical protein